MASRSTNRKINKRKSLHNDTTLPSTSQSNSIVISTQADRRKKEKNKRKKFKYKLKMKQKKSNPNPTNKLPFNTSTSTKSWKFNLCNDKNLSKSQKHNLLKIHNLYKIKERNNATIYNLESALTTITQRTSDISTTTMNISTSNTADVTSIKKNIEALRNNNNIIEREINSILQQEKLSTTSRISNIKKTHSNKGYYLKKRLYHLKSCSQLVNLYHNNRSSFTTVNTANILKQETTNLRQIELIKERIKLSTTDKIHNFIDVKLSNDIINTLNKGTTFIPTKNSLNAQQIQLQIHSEVNQALINVIKNPFGQVPTQDTKSIKYPSHKNTRYLTKKAPTKLLNEEQTNPNFNINLIDYIHHTTTYAKEYLHSHDLNNLIQKQSQNISTSTLQEIKYLENHPDIILSQSDKNMGWTLLPTSWFLSEYNRHLQDSTTYKKVLNFDLDNHINNCNIILTNCKNVLVLP